MVIENLLMCTRPVTNILRTNMCMSEREGTKCVVEVGYFSKE